jgi:hypothetical protein
MAAGDVSRVRAAPMWRRVAQMPCQRDDTDPQKFNRQAVARQDFCPPPRAEV